MKVTLRIYDMVKYSNVAKNHFEVKYDITKYEVKEIPLSEMLKDTDGTLIDEYNEYLILTLTDGSTATYRNSHVDLFRAY